MRIGIDARLRAYRGGGIAEHVDRLLGGLATVAPPGAVVALEHRRSRDPVASFETRRLFTPPHHRLESWTLPIELAPARLDLLHAPDVVVPRLWRGPSVATVHDVAYLRRPDLLTPDSARYYGGIHRSVRAADRVIVVSEHTRRELGALTDVDPERVRVIPNAVPDRYFATGVPSADSRVVAEFGLSEPFILFVSTIEPRKNVGTLLRAYRRLLDTGHEVGLALAGADGWHSEPVYALAEELGLASRARFLGFVPTDALRALYRRAAVLAHPALDEGFGLTPIEAMAGGTPAVVSDAGSLPEVVGDAALRVPPDDPGSWADALGRVLTDTGFAAALAAAGRDRARHFTVERMARSTWAVYQEVLADREAGA